MSDGIRCVLIVIFCFIFVLCFNENLTQEDKVDNAGADVNVSQMPEAANDKTTENSNLKVENLALFAKIDPTEDIEKQFSDVAQVYDGIITDVSEKKYAYQFLNGDGINTIILANLGINHPEVRTKLLIILKTLFEVAPIMTKDVIPKGIVNKLLDIFEKDDNLAIKAHSLDVLHKWLPNNPEIQTRVMKLKGLRPFYAQANKLDIHVIHTMLDLFNMILKEHIDARNEDIQTTTLDPDRLAMYRKIGLIERMETSDVCSGLVNIFQMVWTNNNDVTIVKTVLELIKNSKPYCGNVLKGKTRAIALFENLLKFLKDDDRMEAFEDIGLNVTEYRNVIEDYIDKVKIEKDEL